MTRTRVGIIGCGNVAEKYRRGLALEDAVQVVALADLHLERAQNAAERFGVARVVTPDDLLADPDVELVVNLTVPEVHAAVTRAALESGKSVYSEKPLALDLAGCDDLITLADSLGLRLGSAPDTFLGAGLQTARRVIEDGLIGKPVAAHAQLFRPGPEAWHPSPEFLYAAGSGPILDMGPYYVTALVHLLGPVQRVAAVGSNPAPSRMIGTGPRAGEVFRSRVDTDVRAIGEVASLPFSFAINYDAAMLEWHLEIVGDAGVMRCGDPDTFDGPVLVRRHGSADWDEAPLLGEGTARERGFGVAEMAVATREGRPHRTLPSLARHVLETLLAIEEAARGGDWVTIESTAEQPPPLATGTMIP